MLLQSRGRWRLEGLVGGLGGAWGGGDTWAMGDIVLVGLVSEIVLASRGDVCSVAVGVAIGVLVLL